MQAFSHASVPSALVQLHPVRLVLLFLSSLIHPFFYFFVFCRGRRGATIRVHNVHPVYASSRAGEGGDRDRGRGDTLIGLGGCLRTTVQVT